MDDENVTSPIRTVRMCPAPAGIGIWYPEPRCFSCSAAACVDHDGLYSGLPQACRPWLAPDVVFGPRMIRYVMEDQLELASVYPGAPTGLEVRAGQGQMI